MYIYQYWEFSVPTSIQVTEKEKIQNSSYVAVLFTINDPSRNGKPSISKCTRSSGHASSAHVSVAIDEQALYISIC
jgi:hypothetical protein